MPFPRPLLLAALAALPMSLVACSGGSSKNNNGQGADYKYVANQLLTPTSMQESNDYGLDLNGNGRPDNALGAVLSALGAYGFDIQGEVNTSIAEGTVMFLMDIQTTDFTNASSSSFSAFQGATSNPPACNGGEMYTCDTQKPPVCSGCGHQLAGSAMFTIDPMAMTNPPLAGAFVNGKLTAGPGSLSLPLTISGTNIELNLIGARIEASDVTATTIGSGTGTSITGGIKIGGAVTADDLNNKILPAIQASLGPVIVRDCCGTGNPTHPMCDPMAMPPCGCTSTTSTGAEILGLFDANKDCTVTLDEIKMNTILGELLAPDVTIDGQPALSLGVKATGVGATW
jgi:hypothetical protein